MHRQHRQTNYHEHSGVAFLAARVARQIVDIVNNQGVEAVDEAYREIAWKWLADIEHRYPAAEAAHQIRSARRALEDQLNPVKCEGASDENTEVTVNLDRLQSGEPYEGDAEFPYDGDGEMRVAGGGA